MRGDKMARPSQFREPPRFEGDEDCAKKPEKKSGQPDSFNPELSLLLTESLPTWVGRGKPYVAQSMYLSSAGDMRN